MTKVERRLSPGERVYYHGRMALASSVLMILSYVASRMVWSPILIVTIGMAMQSGWHISNSLFARAATMGGSDD